MAGDKQSGSGERQLKRIIVAATGASGSPLLVKCLKLIRDTGGFEVILIMSESAKLTLQEETDLQVADVERLADVVFGADEIASPPASGTFCTQGMLIAPCSMKSVAGICSGYADNLILRAADVTIKEARTLVLAPRESPLSAIHLKNLSSLALLPTVRIIPPMMTFYQHPATVDDMTEQVASRLLEPFGIQAKGYKRWQGLQSN